jgi:threonine dehydrogenase-like Zn-dependent dehydrogenase
VLFIGAGPIGLLAALIGVQVGAEVHVLDRVTSGRKPGLVEALGATYHVGEISKLGLHPEIVVECTGVAQLVRDAADIAAPGGILCLTGVGPPEAPHAATSATLASDAVLKNLVMFGSVNANRRHYYRAAKVLAKADRSWLEQLVTRRVDPNDFGLALDRAQDDIKVVMDFARS